MTGRRVSLIRTPAGGDCGWPRFPLSLMVLALACWPMGHTEAADLSIRTGKAKPLVHNGRDEFQVFQPVNWVLLAVGEPFGATAQWSCGPFEHAGDNKLKADTRLQVRMQNAAPIARWRVSVAEDQTDIQHGNHHAAVVAQSRAAGVGIAELTVTFANNDVSQLAAGDYTVTVTGTITGN